MENADESKKKGINEKNKVHRYNYPDTIETFRKIHSFAQSEAITMKTAIIMLIRKALAIKKLQDENRGMLIVKRKGQSDVELRYL